MGNKISRRIAVVVLVLAGTIGVVGCGSESDSKSSPSTTARSADATPQQPLTQSEGQAFLAAAVAGSGNQAFSECLAEKVHAASLDGTLTPDQVRDWTNGDAPTGPVQDFISQIEVIETCQAPPNTTVP